DLSAADLAEGCDRRFVGAHHQSWGPTGELTGPLRGQDDQCEMVVHTLEAIFDGTRATGSRSNLWASSRERGIVGLPLAPRRRSRHGVMIAPGRQTVPHRRQAPSSRPWMRTVAPLS